ncbi:MAG: ABC transporter permease [Actinomycetota bacterium]|nr:ABC transporter permease [Actinomycetota bacterium]
MSPLTGTWPLVRLVVRRDRVRLPVWMVAILGMVYGSTAAVQEMYGTRAELVRYDETMSSSPAVIVMSGPPTALRTLGGVTVFEINTTVLVAVALMATFLVVRHTRAEEEAGRTEMLRSAMVGRHAPTAAALVAVGGATVAVAAGIALIMLGMGLPVEGSLSYGASIAAYGLAFTATAACAAQLTGHARGALGVGGAFLGVGFTLRAAGDVGDLALSGLSPLSWVQAVRPFADERWWPIGLLLGFTAGMLALAMWLTTHRDVGSGLVPARTGPASASARLGTAAGLAARLQGGALLGWAVGMFLGGIAFGSLSREVSALSALNEDFAETLAGMGGGVVDAFRATMLLLMGLVAAGFAVSSVLRMRSEETAGRVEPLLATGLSRRRWMAGNLLVTVAGTLLVVSAGGLGMGIADAVVQRDAGQVPRLLLSSLVYVPAALTPAALGVLLLGWLPQVAQATWSLPAFSFVVGWLGTVLDLPAWVVEASPYTHVPLVPSQPPAWAPLLWLTAVFVVLITFGITKSSKRDIA